MSDKLMQLYNHPPTQKVEFEQKRKKAARDSWLSDVKYSEKILAVPREDSGSWINDIVSQIERNVISNNRENMFEPKHIPQVYYLDAGNMFHSLRERMNTAALRPLANYADLSSGIVVNSRRNLEFNPHYLQLVSVSVIHSDTHILLLKTSTSSNQLAGKYTFVQGHAHFDHRAYTSNIMDYLKYVAMKETKEELSILSQDSSLSPAVFDNVSEVKIAVYDTANVISLEHVGFVTFTEVSQELLQSIVSNEPDKHDVVVVPMDSLTSSGTVQGSSTKPDDWTRAIIKYVQWVKQTHLNQNVTK